MLRPYFLTLYRVSILKNDLHGMKSNLRCKVLGRVDTALEPGEGLR